MTTNIFSHFTELNELIQVIYQEPSKFVVISNVPVVGHHWEVHVGLMGQHGRWWIGKWETQDVHSILGSKASDKLIKVFVERLRDTIVQGDMCIGGWDPQPGKKINLTLGPAAKRPLHVPLTELSPSEAASYATTTFFEIALQAQSRRCQLNRTGQESASIRASGLPSSTTSAASSSKSIANSKPTKAQQGTSRKRPAQDEDEDYSGFSPESAREMRKAQEEIKALKAQLERQKIQQEILQSELPEPKPLPQPPRQLKGASLANPNKKARRYQEIEYASDDE